MEVAFVRSNTWQFLKLNFSTGIRYSSKKTTWNFETSIFDPLNLLFDCTSRILSFHLRIENTSASLHFLYYCSQSAPKYWMEISNRAKIMVEAFNRTTQKNSWPKITNFYLSFQLIFFPASVKDLRHFSSHHSVISREL